MTNKQIHNYLLKQLKFICEKEAIPVPNLKRDNRTCFGGLWINKANLIVYSTKTNKKFKFNMLIVLLHELGHCFYGHRGLKTLEINEYLAESFCYYCICCYYPEYIEKYRKISIDKLPYYKTDWPIHYKAFKRVCEENVINDGIITDNKD